VLVSFFFSRVPCAVKLFLEGFVMEMLTLVLFASGLGLLLVGAELLVKGSSRVAASFGISPLVIGLTVVAFGTGSPEFAVSFSTTLSGQTDIAVGNVVGSNVFNVLLILGISATIAPLVVSRQLIRIDIPITIGISVLMLLLSLDGIISRLEGVLLFAGIVTYTAFLISQARKERQGSPSDEFEKGYGNKEKSPLWKNLVFIVLGLALLVLGSRWLVDGAVSLAKTLGVDDVVIGLTIVAAGTSLPELATSMLASIRGERAIAVGNVVGSNIFNVLAVLGASSIIAPAGLTVAPSLMNFDIPVMIAAAIACLPVFVTRMTIARWEGMLFVAYYIAYTAYLILSAYQHAALPAFSNVMLMFVVPITILTLVITTARAFKRGDITAIDKA
jgi:cation:H+ antiporter